MEMTTWLNTAIEKGTEFAVSYGPKIIGAILTYWIGSIIIRKISGFARKRIENSGVDATLAPFFANMFQSILKVLLVLSVVGILGVETTSFAAILAAAGLAIGMALQGSLGNFAGGVLLLIFRPFSVGDVIKAQNFEGEVQEILLFVTILKTLDNRVIYIPNGPLAGGPIENYSREEWRRVDMDFKISGAQDIDQARSVMLTAMNNVQGVAKTPEATVAVTGLTEYATQLQARPYCKPADYYNVWVACQEAIKKSLATHNIIGPTPSQNVIVSQASDYLGHKTKGNNNSATIVQ